MSEHRVDRLNGDFGIRPVLAGPRAAARVMRDLHQWQLRHTEKLGLRFPQRHKDRLAQSDRRPASLLDFYGVVDTPRRARTSSSKTGDDRVAPARQFIDHFPGRALHMGRFLARDDFAKPVALAQE